MMLKKTALPLRACHGKVAGTPVAIKWSLKQLRQHASVAISKGLKTLRSNDSPTHWTGTFPLQPLRYAVFAENMLAAQLDGFMDRVLQQQANAKCGHVNIMPSRLCVIHLQAHVYAIVMLICLCNCTADRLHCSTWCNIVQMCTKVGCSQ